MDQACMRPRHEEGHGVQGVKWNDRTYRTGWVGYENFGCLIGRHSIGGGSLPYHRSCLPLNSCSVPRNEIDNIQPTTNKTNVMFLEEHESYNGQLYGNQSSRTLLELGQQ